MEILTKDFKKLLGMSEEMEFKIAGSLMSRCSNLLTFQKRFIEKENLTVQPVFLPDYSLNIANVFSQKKSQFVSFGPTYISRDGEFKSSFVPYRYLEDIFSSAKYAYVIKIAEKFIAENQIKTKISGKMLRRIIAACISEIHDYIYISYLPNNISDSYTKLFKPYSMLVKELNYYIYLFGSIKKLDVENIMEHNIGRKRIGTKILPLSVNDIRNVGSIRQSSYREIYIGDKLKPFIMSGVGPFFPLIADLAFFEFDNVDVFSNESTFDKFTKSEKYLKNLEHLYKAGQIEGDTEIIETYRQYVKVPIMFAEKELILTQKCFVIFFEYVGRTIADLRTEIDRCHRGLNKSVNSNVYVMSDPFTKLDNFKSLMFYYFYSLYILSHRCRMIHSDLHLNNITYTIRKTKSTAIFRIGGKDYYISSMFDAYIIDFGRIIFHADDIRQEFDTEIEIISDQNKRLVKLFSRLMPEFAETVHVNKALLHNFNGVYKVFYALDPLFLLSNYRNYNYKVLSNEVLENLTEMIIFIEEFIREWLPRAIVGETEIPQINKLLVEEFYLAEKNDDSQFIGFYDGDREIPWDFKKTFPDFYKHFIQTENKKEQKKFQPQFFEKMKKDFFKNFEKQMF